MRMAVHSRWWPNSLKKTPIILLFIWNLLSLTHSQDRHSGQPDGKRELYDFIFADVIVRHTDDNNKQHTKTYEAKYGTTNPVTVSGTILHVISDNSKNHFGCSAYNNVKFPKGKWIALMERGKCDYADKLRLAVKEYNASAIIVYNNVSMPVKTGSSHMIMGETCEDRTCEAVLTSREAGLEIAKLSNQGHVMVTIKPSMNNNKNLPVQNSISKTSVLFVSISFVVLMVISLAWLLFYYIQRFRYSHAKERLARRLACAAKKAIAKIPQKTIKAGDQELEGDFDQCAVCIEQYKAHDIIRILPCRHVFHKSCVDPWLLDQRSCPMCKLDILGALGMQVGGSQESVHADLESGPANQLVPEEPEASSSAEEAPPDDVKVLLVPHSCLHFHSAEAKQGQNDEDEDEENAYGDDEGEASSWVSPQRLTGNTSLASSSPTRRAGPSRAEKMDKEEGASTEVKALIGKSKSSKNRKFSKGEDEEEEEVREYIDLDDCDGIGSCRDVDAVVEAVQPSSELSRNPNGRFETDGAIQSGQGTNGDSVDVLYMDGSRRAEGHTKASHMESESVA